MKLSAVDPGYYTTDALLLDLQWTPSREPAVQQRRKSIQGELVNRLRVLPGVQKVGLINAHPLGGGFFADGLFLEMSRIDDVQSPDDLRRLFDDPQRAAEIKSRQGMAGYRIASEDYFPAMGIRLVRGRLFQDSDLPDAPHVALVSQSLASSQWPGRDPIGRFIQFGNMDGDLRGFRIVGVVSDVREVSPESVPGPLLYGYYKQRMASRFTVVVRTEQAAALAPVARRIASEIDPQLPLETRRVEHAFDRAFAGRRFSLLLIGTFSAVALILATLGIYGLISYVVTDRTREIGIRLALGADAHDVLRLVVSQGLMLALGGMAVGLAAALGLTRFVEGMLFGVAATDPLALGGVLLLTLIAASAASYMPARRAMRVAPVVAMRAE
jgi:predicted permease